MYNIYFCVGIGVCMCILRVYVYLYTLSMPLCVYTHTHMYMQTCEVVLQSNSALRSFCSLLPAFGVRRSQSCKQELSRIPFLKGTSSPAAGTPGPHPPSFAWSPTAPEHPHTARFFYFPPEPYDVVCVFLILQPKISSSQLLGDIKLPQVQQGVKAKGASPNASLLNPELPLSQQCFFTLMHLRISWGGP